MADITITEGDTLEVDYNLENTGDGTGTFNPRLLVQGVQEDQDTGITLDPAQTATGTLAWPTESGDAVTDALAEAVTDDTSDSILVTVEEGIPDVVFDFETGDVSRWDTVNDLSAVSDRVFAGSFAGFCGNAQTNQPQATVIPAGYSGGAQPTTFEYYWQETSSSFGGGVRLFNSNGNVEVGLTTNNPQWEIDDENGIQQVSASDGYDRWVRFTVDFDWLGGTFSVDFEDLSSGSSFTDTNRPLKDGVDIETIQIEDYTSGTWQAGGSIEQWFDEITLLG